MSGRIVIVDTSVFLNILDVPGRNQDRESTLDALANHVQNGDHLYLPVPCIIETGNHIARLKKGHDRYQFAQAFVAAVTEALEERAPWKAVPAIEDSELPFSELLRWLVGFPLSAKQEISLTDLTVKDLFDSFCRKFSMSYVGVWALDGHLSGHQRPVS